MAKRVKLCTKGDTSGCIAVYRECAPFVINERAVLIHRPRRVHTRKLAKWPAHTSVQYLCGNTQSGRTIFTFTSDPPEDGIVCRRCEEQALKAEQPSSSELVGRHVHIGGVRGIRDCCNQA